MPRRHQGEGVPGRSASNEATDDHHTAPNPAPPEEFQPVLIEEPLDPERLRRPPSAF